MFVIKTKNGYYYVGGVSGFQYTPILEEALQFKHITVAIGVATNILGLKLGEYEVRLVELVDKPA